MLRILPPILLVAALLFGCVIVAYGAVQELDEDSGKTTKFRVGVVGTAGDMYLQLGFKALQSLDSSRFAVELVEMDEQEAELAMRKGKLSAFIVIPDGFLDAALRGEIIPVKFVCSTASLNLVTLLKDELTQVIETLLLESQKGTYGAWGAMEENGLDGNQLINDISIEYAEFVFDRSNMYRASRIMAFDGLGLDGYLISGFCVMLFMLICLTFAPAMIRRDHALSRMLSAYRRPVFFQVVCDFAAYFLGLICVIGIALLVAVSLSWCNVTCQVILRGLAVVFCLAAMSFLMYEIASDLISGVLLQFFMILALCFVSGCLYPITFFPDNLQKLAGFLPTGLARVQVANSMLGISSRVVMIALLGYGCFFFAGSMLVRKLKVAGVRG